MRAYKYLLLLLILLKVEPRDKGQELWIREHLNKQLEKYDD